MEQQKELSNQRQSNIELLRIILMLFIIAGHFSSHGGFDFPTSSVTVNRLWTQFISAGGLIGIDTFVLISGYYLIESKSINLGKVLKFWLQLLTYSLLFYWVFLALKFKEFALSDFIKILLPVSFDEWWFASSYFVLYLLVLLLINFFAPWIRRHIVSLLL